MRVTVATYSKGLTIVTPTALKTGASRKPRPCTLPCRRTRHRSRVSDAVAPVIHVVTLSRDDVETVQQAETLPTRQVNARFLHYYSAVLFISIMRLCSFAWQVPDALYRYAPSADTLFHSHCGEDSR